jgi:hypothetical protein
MELIELSKLNPNIVSIIDKYVTIFYHKLHLEKYQKILHEFQSLVDIDDVHINSSKIYEPYFSLHKCHGEDYDVDIEINWRTNIENSITCLEEYITSFYEHIRCPLNCTYCKYGDDHEIEHGLQKIPPNYWFTYPTKESLLKIL